MIQSKRRFPSLLVALALVPAAFADTVYLQHNLVSDLPGVADNLDPNLVNPWGVSYAPNSPFWVSDNKTGVATLYTGAGVAAPLVVNVPPPGGGSPPSAPTGQVFNGTSGFALSPGKSALFLFTTEDGTISGWNPQVDPTNAVLEVDKSSSGAVYKGLAIADTASGPRLYATNFNSGAVDVFDGSFNQIAGGFSDPNIPGGYAPFNIENIGGKLYVTYALQDAAKHDDVAGAGNGFVDVYDLNGKLLERLASNGALNSPWGLALAPSDFGQFSNDLLVGNFGDGLINAYNPLSGALLGTLEGPGSTPISIEGLWALSFGNGAAAGPVDTLFFTAGIPGPGEKEDHGLFGSLQATPEPSTWAMMLCGGLVVAGLRRRSLRRA